MDFKSRSYAMLKNVHRLEFKEGNENAFIAENKSVVLSNCKDKKEAIDHIIANKPVAPPIAIICPEIVNANLDKPEPMLSRIISSEDTLLDETISKEIDTLFSESETVLSCSDVQKPVKLTTAAKVCNIDNNGDIFENIEYLDEEIVISEGSDSTNKGKNDATKGIKRRRRSPVEQLKQQKKKHPLIPDKHNDKCIFKCNTFFNKQNRETNYEAYWNLDKNQRKLWLNSMIKILDTKTSSRLAKNNRKHSLQYYLPTDSGENIRVCQGFFLNSLGFKNNGIIKSFTKSKHDSSGKILSVPKNDMRGKQTAYNKKDKNIIINHIKMFQPKKSHYKREHAPNRLYLAPDLTIRYMYADFQINHPDFVCSYELYRKVVRSQNISFYESNVEMCGLCEELKANLNEKNRDKLEEHLKIQKEARDEYNGDMTKYKTDLNCGLFAADMQKVNLLPRMPAFKETFFTSRLLIFNETFASMKKDKDSHHLYVLWHEALSARKKEDVANAFLQFFYKHRDMKQIIIWLDNCAGQNKNFSLFSTVLSYLNSSSCETETISLKYLTSGHTHMAADGLHGLIEQQIRKKTNLYDFDDFVEVCERSSKKAKVHILMPSQHVKVSNLFRARKKLATESIPYLKDIVEAKFSKLSKEMEYKTNFLGEYKKTKNLLKSENILISMTPIEKEFRGVHPSKKSKIIKDLVPKIPFNRRSFWVNLPLNSEAADLLEEEGL